MPEGIKFDGYGRTVDQDSRHRHRQSEHVDAMKFLPTEALAKISSVVDQFPGVEVVAKAVADCELNDDPCDFRPHTSTDFRGHRLEVAMISILCSACVSLWISRWGKSAPTLSFRAGQCEPLARLQMPTVPIEALAQVVDAVMVADDADSRSARPIPEEPPPKRRRFRRKTPDPEYMQCFVHRCASDFHRISGN